VVTGAACYGLLFQGEQLIAHRVAHKSVPPCNAERYRGGD
jgi:hypothetical protein